VENKQKNPWGGKRKLESSAGPEKTKVSGHMRFEGAALWLITQPCNSEKGEKYEDIASHWGKKRG